VNTALLKKAFRHITVLIHGKGENMNEKQIARSRKLIEGKTPSYIEILEYDGVKRHGGSNRITFKVKCLLCGDIFSAHSGRKNGLSKLCRCQRKTRDDNSSATSEWKKMGEFPRKINLEKMECEFERSLSDGDENMRNVCANCSKFDTDMCWMDELILQDISVVDYSCDNFCR
jgi:hypothetical protein